MTAEEFQMWAENVPEAESLLPPEAFLTETPETIIAPTAMPQLGSCTVLSTYLYIRTCADSSCETLGYVEKDDLLTLASSEQDGWISVHFEGETGWINKIYCE